MPLFAHAAGIAGHPGMPPGAPHPQPHPQPNRLFNQGGGSGQGLFKQGGGAGPGLFNQGGGAGQSSTRAEHPFLSGAGFPPSPSSPLAGVPLGALAVGGGQGMPALLAPFTPAFLGSAPSPSHQAPGLSLEEALKFSSGKGVDGVALLLSSHSYSHHSSSSTISPPYEAGIQEGQQGPFASLRMPLQSPGMQASSGQPLQGPGVAQLALAAAGLQQGGAALGPGLATVSQQGVQALGLALVAGLQQGLGGQVLVQGAVGAGLVGQEGGAGTGEGQQEQGVGEGQQGQAGGRGDVLSDCLPPDPTRAPPDAVVTMVCGQDSAWSLCKVINSLAKVRSALLANVWSI